MGKSKPFTYRAMISIDGAEPIPWEDMTPDQEAYARKKMSERLSRNMSEYYSLHPDQYLRLLESDRKERERKCNESDGTTDRAGTSRG